MAGFASWLPRLVLAGFVVGCGENGGGDEKAVSGCGAGQVTCSGACVSLGSDALNCGACGQACAGGQVCSAGVCGCLPGYAVCNGLCVDVTTNPFNCGSCTSACGPGSACVGATCSCTGTQSYCPAGCVDVQTDSLNCGTCGSACSAQQECAAASCACRTGLSLCGTDCVDLASDPIHCGACAAACATGQHCSLGACAAECATGLTPCGMSCVDLATDFQNCGACGAICAGGQDCAGGACSCPSGQSACAGACVDTEASNSHCGTCDHACTGGRTCSGGTCVCPAGQTACDDLCVDVSTSSQHCGQCGTSCPSGSCVAGQCAGGTGGATSTPDDCSPTASGDVVFSQPSGTFTGSISITLSTSLPSAEIRYTTDGTPPSDASPRYDGNAIQISTTTRLIAQAFAAGAPQGSSTTAIYVSSAIDPIRGFPVVVLDAYGHGALSTTDRSYVDVAFLAYDPSGSTVASLAAFHIRGQSSALFDKRSYRLELRNGAAEDRDCALLGMPADSDFALVAPHADKTLIHNAFVYALGRDLGLQVPRIALVEAFVNVDGGPLSEDDYVGVYQVVEIIKNNQSRLDLSQLRPEDTTEPDITGGYIFKFEWLATEEPLLPCPSGTANCWTDMELVDPNPPNAEQLAYLTGHLVALNTALHGADPANPTTGYPAYLDVPSFVDQVIVHELTRNMDAYVRSQFFHKDRDGLIVAGPLWDFDLIAGVGMPAGGFGTSYPNLDAAGWQYESNATRMTSGWFDILIADPTFHSQLVTRWRELRQGQLSDAQIAARIDTVSAGLSDAATRNFQRWNILADAMVMPFTTPTSPTWAGQLETMRSWLVQRAAWLDTQL